MLSNEQNVIQIMCFCLFISPVTLCCNVISWMHVVLNTPVVPFSHYACYVPRVTFIPTWYSMITGHSNTKCINEAFLTKILDLSLEQRVRFPTICSNTLDIFLCNRPTLINRVEPCPASATMIQWSTSIPVLNHWGSTHRAERSPCGNMQTWLSWNQSSSTAQQ